MLLPEHMLNEHTLSLLNSNIFGNVYAHHSNWIFDRLFLEQEQGK